MFRGLAKEYKEITWDWSKLWPDTATFNDHICSLGELGGIPCVTSVGCVNVEYETCKCKNKYIYSILIKIWSNNINVNIHFTWLCKTIKILKNEKKMIFMRGGGGFGW